MKLSELPAYQAQYLKKLGAMRPSALASPARGKQPVHPTSDRPLFPIIYIIISILYEFAILF
ncbi:hypothetical protein CVM73_12005 [Bradyrhizobium forestalis]|uniref:Uncharacterized protein n=1 Tax=Bradyrhizobium forestalis TaxID=1419263 RepID=A0A2M8RAH3_9BRAD|nr:hypothetical protein CVM73_12005 [Bradyrhizobium forestalis]